MMGSIYSGLSGLMHYSKGLDVISNNVANLNTPGFKSSRVLFQDMFYSSESGFEGDSAAHEYSAGYGVIADKTSYQFTQGELKNTKNETDLAIDGNGFFIIEKEGQQFYTRAGQFNFNEDGKLVMASNGAAVMLLNSSGLLEEFSIGNLKHHPHKITSEVKLHGNLSVDDSEHEVKEVSVIDGSGKTHKFKLEFTNKKSDEAGSWLVKVTDEKNNEIATGVIKFQPTGSPKKDFNTLVFNYKGENEQEQEITLYFGEPGTLSDSTYLSGGSESFLKVKSADGYGVGSIIKTGFNDKGVLTLEYSNGQKTEAGRLGLAHFSYLQGLQSVGEGLFVSSPEMEMLINYADEDAMGKIRPESVELSNVELTQQFTDMIVVQRGFQASSQILTVTNEMIQELIKSQGGR